MILRKNEAKCERCKGIILNMPVQLKDYYIKIFENPVLFSKDAILCGNIVWSCPICGERNFTSIDMTLGEDDYITLIASRYNKNFSVQEVRFD